MKFSTILSLSTIIAASSAANPLDKFSFQTPGKSINIKENKDIPGDSPISLCDAEFDQLVQIKSIDISPNPPVRGSTLNITASGYVSETIEEGAYVDIEVRYGYIRLVQETLDLCEQLENVDMTCPIEAGKVSISKSVDLPNEIPPGKYFVVARAYTVDDELLTCLNAAVEFPIDKRG